MSDREKVINGLECCLHDEDDDHGRLCEKCPYDCGDCRKDLYNDVLGLLKEQEAEIDHLKRPDCEHAEHDGVGCLGYSGCTQDDEPIEVCKRCEKYTGNVYEELATP